MAFEKKEKIKLFTIIGLSLILGAMVYFHFMPDTEIFAAAPEASLSVPDQLEIPKIELKNRQKSPAGELPAAAHRRTVIRDIFSPLRQPETAKTVNGSPEQKLRQQKTIPISSLKLGGTIVGGDNSIAVINEKFVHLGDMFGGFKIIRIEKDAVLLSSGNREVILEMLKTTDILAD